MTKMDLVSIIIPAYNAEKTIYVSINSAVKQTYKNIEIIVVNDGSNDNTKNILEELKKSDERVKVYHKENGGSASARNLGLKMSKGRFIQFLDSDDTLELNAIELLVKKMEQHNNISFILFGFNIFSGNKILRKPNAGDNLINLKDGFNSFEKIEKLMESSCNKFYKKEYIKKQFDENRVFGEDGIFNYENLSKECIILTISDSLYNVQLGTENSVNKRYKVGKIRDLIISRKTKEEKIYSMYSNKFDVYTYRKKEINTLAYTIYLCCIRMKFNESKREFEQVLKENDEYLKELLKLTKYANIQNKLILKKFKNKRYINLFLICKIISLIRNLKLK